MRRLSLLLLGTLVTTVEAQIPKQLDNGAWVQAFVEQFHPDGYRVQVGTSPAGAFIALVIEDAAMLRSSDSAQAAAAKEVALFVLEHARLDPKLALVRVGWKSPGFAGPSYEKTFRFPVSELRVRPDSTR